VYHALNQNVPLRAPCIKQSATYFEYIILKGRRITPLHQIHGESASSSLIKAIIQNQRYCGVAILFFCHDQQDIFDKTIWV
jgi:hypothetical protein